ncbi:MAG: phosphoglucomutase [Flammeovirgaceae bacterium]|jgi:phosphoglucomutase
MEQAIQQKVDSWLNGQYDEETKAEIRRLAKEDEEELINSFYKDLEFGTGGLRGVMGVGSNKMNKYTVGAATQGLANYLLQTYPNEQVKVAIAHDSRNNSPEFSQVVAGVFAANGIKVFMFKELRPTPELSFTIRHLGCHSGVVLTASHNPKEYNGYKAYWKDGGQVIAPHDKNTIAEVNKIQSVSDIKFEGNEHLIEKIGEEIDKAYLDVLKGLSVAPDAIQAQSDLKILFTPIHGTGITLVPAILEKFGFKNVSVVKEQAEPNGNFPTVVYPNPEETEAMSMGLKQAEETNADILLGTDPDADRVAVGVKDNEGNWVLLNGNQTASLLFNYILQARKEKGKQEANDFVCKTIVTTDLIEEVAAQYGVKCYETLTGFKFIAALIKELEGKENFIVGGEESYGYLIGDDVRDKDAIASVAMICEMAAYAKNSGQSLFDMLIALYEQNNFYKEHLISITKAGRSGAGEIAEMMKQLRANPPKTIDGSEVVEVRDIKSGISKNTKTGEEQNMGLPSSNVLQFLTADGAKVSARPSGTEPKIKFYFSVKLPLENKADFEKVEGELDAKIQRIITEMKLK